MQQAWCGCGLGFGAGAVLGRAPILRVLYKLEVSFAWS